MKPISQMTQLELAAFVHDQLRQAMDTLSFVEQGRHFQHPDSLHIVEFPEGPLSVGEEPVKEIREITFETGVLRVISPTDCVKDQLCSFSARTRLI